MRQMIRLMLVTLLTVAALAPIAGVSRTAFAHSALQGKPKAPALRVSVTPGQINLGRDVPVHISVTDAKGKPVANVLLSLSVPYSPRTIVGKAVHGKLTLIVHPIEPASVNTQAGHAPYAPASLQASRPGYAPATIALPIVDGPPATVMAVKNGLSILPPKARPVAGKQGDNLLERYHAVTVRNQLASLGLRDGTLVDLNANTDVVVKDPLHTTLNKGELFLEVVHGDTSSHQIQVGTAVAATKGTRLDVQYNPTTKKAVVTVVEGQVQVTNKGTPVLVGAGQQTTVVANKPPSPPKQVDLTKLLAWVNNLPNTTAAVVPPVLSLPLPHYTPVPAPPPYQAPTLTVTSSLTSTTWSGVVLLQGGVDIPTGKTVTIAAGTIVEMSAGATIDVEGVLTAQGTAAQPIIFTSAQTSPAPGNWSYLRFSGGGATGSVLNYVHFYYGGGSNRTDLELTGGANITVSNDVFADAASAGISVDNGTRPTITNCIIGGNTGPAINAPADEMTAITNIGYGTGQTGIALQGGDMTHNGTWQHQEVPITLSAGPTLDANTSITLDPGSVMEMASGIALDVRGVLKAQGTAAQPIIFTSASSQPAPGNWSYIQFYGGGTSGGIFDHVQVFYGGGSNRTPLELAGGANITVSNDVFAQSAGVGINVDNSTHPTITNCIFAGDLGGAISGPVDDMAQITNIGYGPNQTGIILQGGDVTHSGTWQRQAVPITMAYGPTIDSSASVTIDPGSVFEMASGTAIAVQGVLKAQGTDALPIVFTSALANGQSTAAPGNWQYISFSGGAASGSTFDHVQILYAGGGNRTPLELGGGANVTVSNDVIAFSGGPGIYVDGNTAPTITNCVFSNDAGPAIEAPVSDMAQITDITYSAGQPGIQLAGGDVAHSATWQRQDVPIMLNNMTIDSNATLTLEPGTIIEMLANMGITVQGVLMAQGTAGQQIVFTSAQPQPAAGNWVYINFYGGGASGSVLDHVQVLYAGNSSYPEVNITGGANITITNSVIAFGNADGIYADSNSQPTITGCTFYGIKSFAISIAKGKDTHMQDNHFAPGQRGVETRPY